MAFDLSRYLSTSSCSVLVFECQEGVVGAGSLLPTLAQSVRDGGVIDSIAGLLSSARTAGVNVLYCNAEKRLDGIGNPFNTPLEMRMRAQGGGVPEIGDVVAEVAPKDGDVVIRREHGMTGFYESGLDAYLRNMGTKTVILTGVSVNVGVLGTAIEAVNRGYTVVVPTDCVAGDPPEYAEAALRYSVRNIAFLSTREEIETIWSAA
jgi:nicotinamidase-related amidase